MKLQQKQPSMKQNPSKLNLIFKIKKGSQQGNNGHTQKSIPSSIDASSPSELDQVNLQRLINSQNQLNTMLRALLEQSLTKNVLISKNPTLFNNDDFILVSNLSARKKMQHEKQFDHMLDQRDIVLQHQFDFKVKIISQEIKQKGFLNSSTYQSVCTHIKDFMVQTLANVLSISFKSLNDQKISQKQVKNYAASNIMSNLQSIYKKTIQSLQKSTILKNLQIDVQQSKADLVSKLQSILKNILINLADYYPQAPVTGGTLRMKRAINEVNRIDDQQNDLIYSNGIKIEKYLKITNQKPFLALDNQKIYYGQQVEKIELREDENYTEFIMEVINSAIKTVQSSQNDSRERINKQIFTEFNKELFWLSQDPSFKSLVQIATSSSKNVQVKQAKKIICNYFERIVQNNAQNLKIIEEKIQENSAPTKHPLKFKEQIQQLSKSRALLIEGYEKTDKNLSIKNLSYQIASKRQKSLQQLSNHAIGFKIPNHVKMFNRQQIADKKFVAKHSSILRILTKWAECLQNIFQNPQNHIIKRLYSFKDIHNNLVNMSKQDKQLLVQNLKEEGMEVRHKLEKIKAKNQQLISQIITQKQSFASNVFRFSDTRAVSTKINAVLTSLMVEYLSVLIHHLLKAGQLRFNYQVVHINLIVFRVYDLLRAKLKCSESSFITLLRTIYLLDESDTLSRKFNLVRIKNKLQEPANNIMVNYMFMGNVVCELQLSIQEVKGKEKNYEIFNHFIYELIRGNFGVISECAIIVSQLDPMVNSCNKIYYQQKKAKEVNRRVEYQTQDEEARERSIFYCKVCRKLIINENLTLLNCQQKLKCLKCIIQSSQSIKTTNPFTFHLKQEIQQYLQQNKLIKLKNFEQLKKKKQIFQPILRLDANGKLQFAIIMYVKSELQHFMIKVTPEIIQKLLILQKQIDFPSQIDYFSISKAIKEKRKITDCLIFKIQDSESMVQLLGKLQFKQDKLLTYIEYFAQCFEKFRTEKNLIKSIKFKGQIINCNDDQKKWECFQKVMNVYSVQNQEEREKQIQKELKYKKYNNLQFQKIKVIQAKNCKITSFSELNQKCGNIDQLILSDNQLQHVDCLINKKKMNKLELQNNKLQHLDGLRNIKSINRLELSSNNLKNVEGLKNLLFINSLNLQLNSLENVDGLIDIKSINTLVLNQNQLRNVDGLINITTMKTLQLNENHLQNVDGLRNLTSINQLYLGSNQLQNITGLQNIKTINKLYLQNNHLKNVDGLENINNIKEMYLSNNLLQNLDGMRNITTIDTLQLNENKLKNIDGLENLVNIKQLYIYNNLLQNIDGLRNLITIDILQLNENQLQNVDGLRNMSNIKYLYLQNNRLQNIDGLQNVNSIKELELDNNCLQNVDGLRNVTDIKQLYLHNNKLQDINGLKNITTIKSLKLENNQLQNVDGLRSITSIKQLYLHHNQLENVDGLANITTIDTLQINQNRLQCVDGLVNITSINKLKLSRNQLTNIEGLSNISTISKLYLSHNKLKHVDQLLNITAINTLCLAYNQLNNINGLKNITSISRLHLQQNSNLQINFLFPSLQIFSINLSQLYKIEFKDALNLKILFSDSQNRSEFKKLPTQTELKKIEQMSEYSDY